MSTRRHAREWAVQLLFQLDMNTCEDVDRVLRLFWDERETDVAARDFAERLVRGTVEHLAEIDEALCRHVDNWDIGRIGTVERNALRMGVFELLFCSDIPPVVSINEAVDVAKYFSSDESGRFVNGILDRIRKGLDRPARRAITDEEQAGCSGRDA